MSGLYASSAIGFLATERAASSGLYAGPAATTAQDTRPQLRVLGPMEQFEVWRNEHGTRQLHLRINMPADNAAFFEYLKDLPFTPIYEWDR
jgi:hypothetical protein